MLYGVCTTLFWSCHLGIMLHKNVQRNQYPPQQGSGPRRKVTNSIKSLWKSQAGWCVMCPSRRKVQGNSLFSPNSFRAAAETQLYHGQTEAIFSCCDSWKQAEGFYRLHLGQESPEGWRLQLCPACSDRPLTTSSSISSALIMRGKDRVRLCM